MLPPSLIERCFLSSPGTCSPCPCRLATGGTLPPQCCCKRQYGRMVQQVSL